MSPGSAEVVIQLLGGFRVAIGDREVPESAWSTRRAAELVQLLALADGRQVIRDQAIDALWPHLGLDAGAANLRKAAHHARQALGDAEAVALRGGLVRLFPDRRVAVDVDEFLASAAACRSSVAPGRCEEVADLYRGDLLPGALYEEWTQEPRAHLRSAYLDVLRAGGLWARLVEVEPTDEAAYRGLMREAISHGARSSAIRWYGRLRSALARELGVRPDAETERLYDECVAGLDTARPAVVGRDIELARVRAALADLDHHRGAAIVLRGSAGIGKSALCREIGEIARERGWRTVEIAVGDDVEPYGPIKAAVEQVVVSDRGLLDQIGELARSILAALVPLAAPAPPLEGTLGRHQVIGAVRRTLVAAGAGRPVVLVVDDAHLADDASLDALLHLATSGPPLGVVVAHRTEPVNRTLERGVARLQRAARATVVDLGPLEPRDAGELVAAAATTALAGDVVAQVVERGAGNPFVTLELARSAGAVSGGTLPPSVSAAITDRLVDLDDRAVAVLKRVALASDDLDSATVMALTGSAEDDALEVLDLALDAGVLTVVSGRYRFRHDLVRQALVEQVPPHERAAVHRDAARRLTAAGAAPGTVARHWLAGERPDEAVGPLLAAAARAVAVGAFADAIAYLEPLLAHAPDHAEALRMRAEALDVMGEVAALPAYDAAIHAADSGDVDDLRAKRALAQLKQGDVTGALEALVGVAPRSVDARLAEALTYSGAAALGYVEPTMGTAKSAECRRLALESGDTAAIVVASWAQAAAAHARGELRDSVLADLRDTHDVPHLATRVFDGQLCVTQRLLYGARPYADVIQFADALTAEAQRLGAARGEAFGVTLRGEAELLSGKRDEAERDLRRGARLHRQIGGATGEALALQRLAELALQRGERAEAEALLAEALDLARITDIGFHLLDRIYGTRVVLAGDPAEALLVVEEAEESVRGTLETCPGCRITYAVPAAIAAAQAGDLARAAQYEEAAAFLASVVMRLPAWNAALDEVRASIARAEGDAAATGLYAAAAKGFADAGQPYDAARCEELARQR